MIIASDAATGLHHHVHYYNSELSNFRMSKPDIKQYLQKLYQVPVRHVVTKVVQGWYIAHNALSSLL